MIIQPFTKGATLSYVLVAFAAVAWHNAIELIILCLVTFKRRRGMYFWSMLVASASIIPHTLGFVLLFFPTGAPVYLCLTLTGISWCGMVTGHSLVLWSRLHLILRNRKVLLGVLWMILIDAVIIHIPILVLFFGAVSVSSDSFVDGYNVMERIQLIWFCVQEMIISGIYVWETVKLLRLRPEGPRYTILRQLLAISIIILLLDVTVVVIEYVGLYAVQVMFKPVVYSWKLKLEFAILGRLVAISRSTFAREEPPSSGRGLVSLPSSQERPLHEPRPVPMEQSLPWFLGN